MRFHHVVLVGLAVCLACVGVALAEPPSNDARAAAQVVPSFPATIPGTLVGATVERLDPQVSDCGRVESTVWYRIDQAPDGTVVLEVSGAGLAPVLRVYALGKNSISERACASARAGEKAVAGFETRRGASYLVLVGKRPGTADAAFTLQARLFYPPANDDPGQARPLKVPGRAQGSTFGATAGESDPYRCDLEGGTVWYRLVPGAAPRVVLRLEASGDLDAAMVVVERIRSKTRAVACAATDRSGKAITAFTVDRGATTWVVVGQQEGSQPGSFTLDALGAQPAERAPGKQLRRGTAVGTVNGLTDVNDVWWTKLQAGVTYRLGFRSEGCARLVLAAPTGTARTLGCAGYTTITPGREESGRYMLDVRAPEGTRGATYRVRLAAASADDVGVGIELPNLARRAGTLTPSGVDVVDLYHFDVAQRSEVRIRLSASGQSQLALVLVSDDGSRIAASARQIERPLDRGRYVVAVRGVPGSPAARYVIGLVVREVTQTSLTASASEIVPGASLVLRVVTTPTPAAGRTEIRIDRFDPLTGWHYSRTLQVAGAGGSIAWTPPTAGRWRAQAFFLGTLASSPSRSTTVRILVATPLPAA